MPLRPDMQPQDYLSILLRRKWLILFTVLVILFGASVYCVVTPERFRSTTTILVIPQKVPEGYVQTTVSIKIEDRLATIQQQVMSRTRLVAVMDELGLFKEDRKKLPLEDVVEKMRKRIEIQVRKNDAFTLSFSHENPQTAMLTTSRIASFFIDENLKTREQQAVGTSEFLDSQLQEVKSRLEAAESKVRQYKMRFMGELPQQMQANLQQLSRLQDQLRTNSESTRSREERRAFLESQISSLEAHIRDLERSSLQAVPQIVAHVETDSDAPPVPVQMPDPAATLLPELALKKARLEELSGKYTDRYPEIQRLRREVEQLEGRVAELRRQAIQKPVPSSVPVPKKKGVPTVVAQAPAATASPAAREREEVRTLKVQAAALASELPALRKERQEILSSIAALEARVAQSPRREQEMIALTRDYENMKASYEDLLRKKTQADISQNLEKRQKGEQFQILDPANLPEEPYAPNRKLVFAIASVAAFGLAIGGAVGLEFLNPALATPEDFRHFFRDLPVLATIPVVRDREYVRRESLRKGIFLGTVAFFLFSVAGFLLVFGSRIRAILGTGG